MRYVFGLVCLSYSLTYNVELFRVLGCKNNAKYITLLVGLSGEQLYAIIVLVSDMVSRYQCILST